MTHANKDFGFSRSRLGQGIFAATLALCLPGTALATDLLGGGSLLDVGVGIGGIDVEASVGGGSLASACVGHCGAGGTGTGGGTGGNPDGTPGGGAVTDSGNDAATAERIILAGGGAARCGSGGNSAVYNGFVVQDRNGTQIGWVKNTTLDADLRIVGMDIFDGGSRCTGLRGGSYRIEGQAVRVNIDASRLR
ncbi:MAG: hypothetical protein V4804_02560 [Pseudomonadota bacterium]